MSESNYKPDGTGVVMGDRKPMPERGTGTGMTGVNTVTDGRDLGVDAINRLGALTGTDSDPMAECYVDDPTFGAAKGDAAEDRAEGY
jgi:hypothetical protein